MYDRPTIILLTAFKELFSISNSWHTYRQHGDEMKPSIDAAAKMANILEVSLDWLVGNTDTELDTTTLNRIQDIDKLPKKEKELVYEFLDSFIANKKIKNVLQ